jgi:hypothetical protein
MNERIKQFVIQAGFSETYGLKEKERLNKFAELIVWECAMVASTETSDDGVGEVIKEHFGIKE